METATQAAGTGSKAVVGLSLDIEETKNALAVVAPEEQRELTEAEKQLEAQAEATARRLLSVDPDDAQGVKQTQEAVNDMGVKLQKQAGDRNRLLQKPIRDFAQQGEEGSPVAQSLTDLRMQVESLDPAKWDFEGSWFSRLLGKLPGVGSPVKKYFTQYMAAEDVIEAIDKSLVDGRDSLAQDNAELTGQAGALRHDTKELKKQVHLGQLLAEKIEAGMATLSEERRAFAESEVLFPLRQRVMDLQQQLAVSQQGVLAMELVRRNNVELMKGIDRARHVTLSALNVAVTVAAAVENQKLQFTKIKALNETTSSLIASTAKQLRTQGVEIQKQASSSMLDMDSLRSAFNDTKAAITEVDTYRKDALPKMAEIILEFDELSQEAQGAIERMEEGQQRGAAQAIGEI